MSTKVHVQRDQHDSEDVKAEAIVECPECAKLNQENQSLKELNRKLKEQVPSNGTGESQRDMPKSSSENGGRLMDTFQVSIQEAGKKKKKLTREIIESVNKKYIDAKQEIDKLEKENTELKNENDILKPLKELLPMLEEINSRFNENTKCRKNENEDSSSSNEETKSRSNEKTKSRSNEKTKSRSNENEDSSSSNEETKSRSNENEDSSSSNEKTKSRSNEKTKSRSNGKTNSRSNEKTKSRSNENEDSSSSQAVRMSEVSACCTECEELFWDQSKYCPVDCELRSIYHLLSVINMPFCPRKLEKYLLLLDLLWLSKGRMPMLQPSDLFNCTTTVNSLCLHGFLECVLEIDVQKDDDIKDVLNRCYKELNDTVGLVLYCSTDSSGHCVTMVRHEGKEVFHIADAQKEMFFPECEENVDNIEKVYLLQLTKDGNKRKIENLYEMCGIASCLSKDPTAL